MKTNNLEKVQTKNTASGEKQQKCDIKKGYQTDTCFKVDTSTEK